MVLFHSCKLLTNSAGSCDMQVDYLLLMPIKPESVSRWGIDLDVCVFVVI